MTESTPLPTNTSTDPTASPPSHPFRLPNWLTAPIESVFAFIGATAATTSTWVRSRGSRATARARPWLEFIDLSAFGPAEGGFSAYIERIKLNAPYFMFNYLMLGLALTCFSVVTSPLALIGSVLLVWLYFQFFGAEATEEYEILGFSFDDSEKLGILVFFGFLVFWITAGGFGIFLSVCTAVLFVTAVHGAFRKPSQDAMQANSGAPVPIV